MKIDTDKECKNCGRPYGEHHIFQGVQGLWCEMYYEPVTDNSCKNCGHKHIYRMYCPVKDCDCKEFK